MASVGRDRRRVLKYKIASAPAKAYIVPLLEVSGARHGIEWVEADDASLEGGGDGTLWLAWEDPLPKAWRQAFRAAPVQNCMHNASLFESKADLAVLQWLAGELRDASPDAGWRPCMLGLPTFVCEGAKGVEAWARAFYARGGAAAARAWWMVKAERGNGGFDVWPLHAGNLSSVVAKLPASDTFVVQKYVDRPELHGGEFKFHYRVQLLVTADSRAFLFRQAMKLPAAEAFSLAPGDGAAFERAHITNQAQTDPQHAAEMLTEDIAGQRPALWAKLLRAVGALVAAAEPMLRHQRGPGAFELAGIDVMPDADGEPWVLEINRFTQFHTTPPTIYAPMMDDFLRHFLYPLATAAGPPGDAQGGGRRFGGWHLCERPGAGDAPPAMVKEEVPCAPEESLVLNVLRWAAAKRRWRRAVAP